jgi:hypothetical protein
MQRRDVVKKEKPHKVGNVTWRRERSYGTGEYHMREEMQHSLCGENL